MIAAILMVVADHGSCHDGPEAARLSRIKSWKCGVEIEEGTMDGSPAFLFSPSNSTITRTTWESLDRIPAILLRRPPSCANLTSLHLWASTLRPIPSVPAASPASL